jgi:hypothetical protein
MQHVMLVISLLCIHFKIGRIGTFFFQAEKEDLTGIIKAIICPLLE